MGVSRLRLPTVGRSRPNTAVSDPQGGPTGLLRSTIDAMRAPVDHILAPAFPRGLEWVNNAPVRMDQEVGRPVLIEFWDFCRVNSLRTLPYLKAWHQRYEPAGLRVIGVHASGFAPSADPNAVRAAV